MKTHILLKYSGNLCPHYTQEDPQSTYTILYNVLVLHIHNHTLYCTLLAVRAMLAVGLLTPGTAGGLLATHAASSYPPS